MSERLAQWAEREAEESDESRDDIRLKLVELHPLPLAGWLWTTDYKQNVYAMDYEVETVAAIADGAFAVSPDGATLAEVAQSGKVTFSDFQLPPPPPEVEEQSQEDGKADEEPADDKAGDKRVEKPADED